MSSISRQKTKEKSEILSNLWNCCFISETIIVVSKSETGYFLTENVEKYMYFLGVGLLAF
jgi:hypothetical protein